MRFSPTIRLLLVLLGLNLWAAAQDSTAPPQETVPAPAFGQTAPILDPENPPISSLDQPSLEMRTATRSFFSPGLQVSESADTNPNNQLGGTTVKSATHVLGALDVQRFWPKSDLITEYLGGGVFFNSGPDQVRQLHALAALGVTRWRTGRLTLRDAFTDLPEGSFSLGTGAGTPGLGLTSGGLGAGMLGGELLGSRSFGNGDFGGIGVEPRIVNTAIADVVQSLTPRSAFTVESAFSLAHFLNADAFLINSEQWTFEGGYSYLLGRRDQIAAVYGFQDFLFPIATGGDVQTHVFNLRYGHTISGRMSLLVGGGPQYLQIYEPGGGVAKRWSASALAKLHYRFPRTSVSVTYEKFTSAGSGLFAGADSQVGRASVMRPIGRTWELHGDLGYSYHKRLQQLLFAGIGGQHFSDGFAGVILKKHLGRNFAVFGSYHFNELALDTSPVLCTNPASCSRISNRNTVTIGVDWHPRPVRIE